MANVSVLISVGHVNKVENFFLFTFQNLYISSLLLFFPLIDMQRSEKRFISSETG